MDVRRLAALLLLWLLALAVPGRAERLILKNYTTADGLADDAIQRIVVDGRGFLWFCTGNGLSRFDGNRFTNYGTNDGLPSALINDLLPAADGQYWIATSAGLVRFDPSAQAAARFTIYEPGPEARARYVTAVVDDREGGVWVGTLHGLFRVTARSGQPVALAAVDVGLPRQDDRKAIVSLTKDRRGALWIGTRLGLYRWRVKGDRVERVALPSPGDDSPIHALLEDRNGDIWVGTKYSGLLQLTVDAASQQTVVKRVYAARRGLPTDWVTTIMQTSDGTVWAGSNAGLIQLVPTPDGRGHRIRVYSTKQGLSDLELGAIAEDHQRNLWLGLSHGGVAKLWHRGLTTFDAVDGLSWTASMATTHAGDLVVLGGPVPGPRWYLHRFDGVKFVAIKPPMRGATPGWGWNQTVLEDHTGDWWIGTNRGVFRFARPRTIADVAGAVPAAIYTSRDGLRGPIVLRQFEDSRGDVWIATVGAGHGLSRWQRATNTFRHYDENDGLPPLAEFYVASFAEAPAGHVWIGFSGLGGLARQQDDGRFLRFTAAQGAPPGRISNLLLDSAGRLWAATDRAGVVRIEAPGAARPTFVPYTTAQGLSSNVAEAVVEDRRGRIYVGTGRGIDRIDPASGGIRHYNSASGVPTGASAAVRDGHGALWFNTRAGLVRLLPDVDRPERSPPILVSGLSVGGRPHSMSVVGEAVVRLGDLSPDDTRVEIDFVAPGFGPGENIRYQYRLEGADRIWSAPSAEHTVTYANLAPGQYTFLVRAVNEDAMVSETPASVAFTVLTPIWWRWWFVTPAGLAVTAAAYGLHRARVRRLLTVARMRTSIAADLHDDIGANLTRIAVLSELARRQPPPSGTGADRRLDGVLASIARIARESVSGMSDIVWAINPDRDNLSDLARKMREHVEDVCAARNLDVVFNLPVGRTVLKISGPVRRDVYLIFKEAVNNASRHSGCSTITIDLRVERVRLYLAVIDDGAGFDPATDSDGQGLVSMRRRARRLGAVFEVDSRVGLGTTIRLTVSVGDLPR